MVTPPVAQPSDQGEQAFGVLLGQRTGGLVEHEKADVEAQSTGNLDELPGSGTEVGDARFGSDFRVFQHRQRRGTRAAVPRPGAASPDARLDPEQHVLRHCQVRGQRQLLVDHGDAEPPGGLRTGGGYRELPSKVSVPGVGLNGAAEDLHQRRFAGTILADQGMDLAGS